MKSSLKPATKSEKRRIVIIKSEVGCIACYQNGNIGTWADAHHIISEKTGRRISHSHTIPLCSAHHTGPYGIHKRKKWFADTYGSDKYLLGYTNDMVAQFEASVVGRLA